MKFYLTKPFVLFCFFFLYFVYEKNWIWILECGNKVLCPLENCQSQSELLGHEVFTKQTERNGFGYRSKREETTYTCDASISASFSSHVYSWELGRGWGWGWGWPHEVEWIHWDEMRSIRDWLHLGFKWLKPNSMKADEAQYESEGIWWVGRWDGIGFFFLNLSLESSLIIIHLIKY